MMSISERNYVGVAPRGPVTSWDGGYEWPQTRDCVHQSHSSVVAAIDEACCRFNIATDRIFLAGVGTGGTMAFRLACREPELFAGVISINGQFPEQFKPLARLKSCRNFACPLGPCLGNRINSVKPQLCQQLRLLHVCGFSVTLRQYPCGDEIMAQAFSRYQRLGSWTPSMARNNFLNKFVIVRLIAFVGNPSIQFKAVDRLRDQLSVTANCHLLFTRR